MYRHHVGNFKDIVFINTMWDLQRLLQDKLSLATSQANWADVPQPLELIRTAVAADVLNHFAFEAAQGCHEYDPEEAIELRGDSLRSAREFLINHLHAETRHTIGNVLDDAVEERAAALLNPAFVRLGLANPVEKVWRAAEIKGGKLAHRLVKDVYEQLRSGSPCLPPYLVRTGEMADRLGELMTALLPVLEAPGLEIDKKSSPAEVYADTLQDMAREYVFYMLNAVGAGTTVWTCDHVRTPSRLAGEILADLGLTPIHDSNYSCAIVATPQALVLREMNLVMQVLEDHLETGELRLYADEEYQTRWRSLHRRGAIPEVSEEIHAAAVAAVLKPFFTEAFDVLNTMMLRLDNWQVERLPADGIYPRPKASPVEGEQLDEEAAEKAEEAEDNEDMDDDTVLVGDEAVISERRFAVETAENQAPETRLALAVVTNLLADFTRLSEDHLRMVEERPLTAQTPKEKELETLQREVALDMMGSLKEEAYDKWSDLLRDGAHAHDLTAPDEMRAFFSKLFSVHMGEKFSELAEETASGMTDAYLYNPAWSRLALFDSGSQAMDEGIETARHELRVIFRKLTRGTAFLGAGELVPGLSTDCQSALEAAGRDIGKILRKATRSVRRLVPSGPNTLDTCA